MHNCSLLTAKTTAIETRSSVWTFSLTNIKCHVASSLVLLVAYPAIHLIRTVDSWHDFNITMRNMLGLEVTVESNFAANDPQHLINSKFYVIKFDQWQYHVWWLATEVQHQAKILCPCIPSSGRTGLSAEEGGNQGIRLPTFTWYDELHTPLESVLRSCRIAPFSWTALVSQHG